MRRTVRNGVRWRATPVLALVLTVALALMAGAYMGVAFADEESDAASGLGKTESSMQGDEAAQDGESGDENAEGESTTEPSSEVVTSYYHDAWYEAGLSDGAVVQDESEDDANADDAEEGSESASDEEGADSADGEDEGELPELDPKLNNLGEGNTIDLQQVPDTSFLYDTSIYDLVNLGASGGRMQTVAVKGEVVGEPIRAANGKYWITLDHVDDDEETDGNKKEASISVLIDSSTLQLIDTYGGYNKRGTILRVRGTFYYACTSHEGIMDIHAESVSVSERGETTTDVLDRNAFMPGIVLCVIALALSLVYHILAERQK